MPKKEKNTDLSNNDLSLKVADDALERTTREGSKNIEFAFSKVVDLRADLSVLEVAVGVALSVSRMLAKKRDRVFAEGQVKLAELTGKNNRLSVGAELLVRISPEAAGMVWADLVRCGLSLSYQTDRWVEFRGVTSGDMARSLVGQYGGEVIELPAFCQLESQSKLELDISQGRTEEPEYTRGVESDAQPAALQDLRPEMPKGNAPPRQTAQQEISLQQDYTQVPDSPGPYLAVPEALGTNRSRQDAESEKAAGARGVEGHEVASKRSFSPSAGTRATPITGPRRLPNPAPGFLESEASTGKPMDFGKLRTHDLNDY
ncbi:hypothetical protein [Microvirga arabica]|uniref:hypothetical protein n=1 Tax=Microvirga arabica TaxID=1128671 RepID=UPI001939528B|nr:hypothetical protein [Microvirga arabica]MBM1173018.1 hypothetical protein [Microvirga arabica]